MNKILKNTINKVAYITVVTIALYSFNGCENMLDKNPLGSLNESILNTKEAVDKLLISCYSPLNGYISVGGWQAGPDNMYFSDMLSGNMHKGSTTGDQAGMLLMERYAATSDNNVIRTKWRVMYGAIDRCNDVLRTLNENTISDLNEADKNQIIAEARFLRGYYHFEAKKIWNMVPYIDETVTDLQRRVPNDRDIWPDIEAEFSYAMNILPVTQSEPGRPTSLVAKAFLAKAYLFQQKYSEAKVLLDEIIASGRFQLMPNFYDNFNVEKNNNIEAVWQNQVAVNVAGASYNRSQRGGDLAYPNAPEKPKLSGAGFNQPTFDLVNAYKTSEDGLPLFDSYWETDFKNDQGLSSSEPYTLDTTTPVDPRLDWTVGRRGVPYHDWGLHPGMQWIRDQISAGPYNQKKYVILESQVEKYSYNNTAKFNALNFNIIRYAQILLWAAECEIEAGNPEKARQYVNMVRARARDGIYVSLGPNAPFGDGPYPANYHIDEYNEPWTGMTKDWQLQRVRFEHRLEFALEGHYFYDLVRWNVAEEYINAYLSREIKHIEYLRGVSFGVNNRYLPIPLVEIDRSYVDGKPTLKQNPGY